MIEVNNIYEGECLPGMQQMASQSVHCIVTSPPYYGVRDYKVQSTSWPEVTFSLFGVPVTIPSMECCLGLEPTPIAFVAHIVLIFREAKRVLHNTGTAWINFGDSYAGGNSTWGGEKNMSDKQLSNAVSRDIAIAQKWKHDHIKPKDLIGIPWMVAFALRDDGWYLRSDIIWHKPNPMPESVTDRPTKAHEYIFLLSKSQQYYYDAEAIKTDSDSIFQKMPDGWDTGEGGHGSYHRNGREKGKTHREKLALNNEVGGRGFVGHSGNFNKNGELIGGGKANKRSVWVVATMSFKEAHFATFPEDLIVDCIKAGTSEHGVCSCCGNPYKIIFERTYKKHEKWFGEKQYALVDGSRKDASYNEIVATETKGWQPTCKCNAPLTKAVVLDPFMGAGTTALVASKLHRNYIGFELNPAYIKIAETRLHKNLGLFHPQHQLTV